jgi:hypothetical protein
LPKLAFLRMIHGGIEWGIRPELVHGLQVPALPRQIYLPGRKLRQDSLCDLHLRLLSRLLVCETIVSQENVAATLAFPLESTLAVDDDFP